MYYSMVIKLAFIHSSVLMINDFVVHYNNTYASKHKSESTSPRVNCSVQEDRQQYESRPQQEQDTTRARTTNISVGVDIVNRITYEDIGDN